MSRQIAVIGTGYVGLVSGVGLADFGNHVTCCDILEEKIKLLNNGKIPIYEPGIQEYFDKNVKAGRLLFTSDIDQAMRDNEVIFIGVGTPPKDNGEADLSQVQAVVQAIGRNLNGYKVIVTKSTVPIGTNRWIKEQIAKQSGKDCFDVVSNPEFLREGKAIQDFFHPDRVVVGYESEKAKETMSDIYRSLFLIETPFIFCSLETAELIKYASNAFLATKIMFINQIANLCEAVGADVNQVAKAMGKDGRIGSKFLHPGPGYGGSCFPKDTKALVEIGNQYHVEMSLVKAVISSNEAQKERMVQKLEKALGGNLENKTVAILGLAFKAETDDMRDSPAIVIINCLLKKKALIKVHDPQAMENARKLFGSTIEYAANEYEAVKQADALVLLTEWNEYRSLDLDLVKQGMKGKHILDTRNLFEPSKVRALGFVYEGVGR
ncbi:MAG TPA: UDP-glucose 6-dehydrogenase [Firmicutes bacterium]|jgi:UDPglucose 6-dehydrogenase|nr:UDP-glucose 6-dehydrogenase [Bacillota bacterium]